MKHRNPKSNKSCTNWCLPNCDSTYLNNITISEKMRNQGRGEATSHTFSWMKNPNDVLTLLAKWSAKVLPVDLCTDHAHYVKNHRSTVLGRTKNMAVQGGTVSHYYILVIRKLLILFRFSDIVCGFLFLLSNFPLQSLEYATYSSLWLISTAEELSYRVVFCCKRDSENREFYDLPGTFLHHGKKRILHAKMYQIASINWA